MTLPTKSPDDILRQAQQVIDSDRSRREAIRNAKVAAWFKNTRFTLLWIVLLLSLFGIVGTGLYAYRQEIISFVNKTLAPFKSETTPVNTSSTCPTIIIEGGSVGADGSISSPPTIRTLPEIGKRWCIDQSQNQIWQAAFSGESSRSDFALYILNHSAIKTMSQDQIAEAIRLSTIPQDGRLIVDLSGTASYQVTLTTPTPLVATSTPTPEVTPTTTPLPTVVDWNRTRTIQEISKVVIDLGITDLRVSGSVGNTVQLVYPNNGVSSYLVMDTSNLPNECRGGVVFKISSQPFDQAFLIEKVWMLCPAK